MRCWLTIVVLSVTVLAGCTDKSTPTNPSPTQLDVTGRWSGDLTFMDINGRMSWTLTQTNAGVSGPVLVALPNGIVLLNGFLVGTLTGSALAYVISVGPGGIPLQPTCAGQLGGTMTVASGVPPTMTGPMAVTSSNCTIQFSADRLTLTKQ